MNRQDLIDAIAEDTEASKAATTRFLDSLITIVQNEVAKGGAVKLTGFGTFEKAAVAARTGRNPKTGAPIKIPSTHKPKFTPGATFKDLVKD
ncbi:MULTISPECIES: HU family DNA-binding protein [Pseudomonadota]|jgi:DNA-binding protein HU-beta|uniref:Histone family protein DNA-binding protein n=4 Tax=Betaproteobacteria TaxID=28216 RepID=F4GGX3_ALIDK|nr:MULTISPECIES: HU family DNA-binding protein [Pseudomonadota]ABM44336.1 histone family protein DNA-binding protein [Acidovorax sp. JS42]EAP0894731.1 HU family DNA-binding protein [Salmonella enterica]MBP7965970.1 HU family DNA-binding protein [Burkholderiaceae bacterium]TXH14831.1 MAG: HU family DNA-binding protein [Gammaproteobacteria bacterium]UOB07576.1 HU family DNA-binding protein [[Acidovorax] ebreus]BCZ16601.1 DNA-binding protein HU-alpha [Comamonas testosteroni]